jgi:3D (Asp-Asp-Asp) domain-containing protein
MNRLSVIALVGVLTSPVHVGVRGVETHKMQYYSRPRTKIGLALGIGFLTLGESVRATCYNAVPAQCDANPLETADGSIIKSVHHAERHRWVAVSRDLLPRYHYGDKVFLSGLGVHSGVYTVHDAMNRRYRHRVDVLVGTKSHITHDAWQHVHIRLVSCSPKHRNVTGVVPTKPERKHESRKHRRPTKR